MSETDRYFSLDKLRDADLKTLKPAINGKYIKDYDNWQKGEGLSISTTATNKNKLYILFSKYVNKDWLKYTPEQADKIKAAIKSDDSLTEKTKSNYLKMFKQLDKFLNGKYEPSDRTRHWKTTPQRKKLNTLTKSDLLTDADKKKLIRATDNKRDRAIISIWLETGLRPKELRVLTIGSITLEKDIAYVNVPSETKTGFRPVPVYFSRPAIIDWLNEHAEKDNPKAPLWYNLRHNEIKAINDKGFDYILEKVVKRSKLNKRIYWYLGRHNSYTDKIADGWNEGIIKQFHGIDAGSSVLNRYVHLSGKDVTNKVKEYYGIEKGKKKEPELSIINCINCGKENQSTNPRCSKCGYILDPKLMKEELEKAKNKDSEIENLKQQMQTMKDEIIAEITKNLKTRIK